MIDLLSYGYLGLFLGTILAATIIPFSSEFILVGLLLSGFDPLNCLLVASIGNSIGSYITYSMGRILDYQSALNKMKIRKKHIKTSEKFFNKYGIWIGLIAWIPIVGDAFTFVLGVYKTSILPTFILIFIGKTTRFAILIYFFL